VGQEFKTWRGAPCREGGKVRPSGRGGAPAFATREASPMRWEESAILTAKPAGEVSRLAEAQSLRSFVRNVTDFDGLDYHLMKAGRAELGVGGEEDQVARRASKLLLLALCA